MPALLFGVVLLAFALWFLSAFSKANPHTVASYMRPLGGVGAVALAAFLGLRGEIAVALPIGLVGLGFLGYGPWAGHFARSAAKGAAKVSRVHSAFLEMELDHDTGAMRGRILAGRYAGTSLQGLDLPTLVGFLATIDEESRALLIAYLDRQHPQWREHAQGDAAAGQRGASHSGKMTEEEAYQILGIQPGTGPIEIGRAHRSLMKKLHPDQGGSTYLAARVNEAKDVLLRRHRR